MNRTSTPIKADNRKVWRVVPTPKTIDAENIDCTGVSDEQVTPPPTSADSPDDQELPTADLDEEPQLYFTIGGLADEIVRRAWEYNRKSEKADRTEPFEVTVEHKDWGTDKWYCFPELVREVALRTPPPWDKGEPGGHTKRPWSDKAKTDIDATDRIWVKQDELKSILRAMLTRPLILLAGISGSGKTQIAKRLGKAWAQGLFGGNDTVDEALGKLTKPGEKQLIQGPINEGYWIKDFKDQSGDARTNGRPRWNYLYSFTAVKSDWTEASHLWGYHVPLPEDAAGFYGTPALRVFLEAQEEWRRTKGKARVQAFVLLDEMNLSRPEYYGSDLLSAMEVRSNAAKGREAEPVIQLHQAGADVPLRGENDKGEPLMVPHRMGWTDGVIVMGTVNVDETTFFFAPKVLDRAAMLEFTDVELQTVLGDRTHYAENKVWFNDLHTICRPYNLHLGYRAAKEILEALEKEADGRRHEVLDEQLRNKVLPRVRGSRSAVVPILVSLLNFAWSGGDRQETVWTEDHTLTFLGPNAGDEQKKAIDSFLNKGNWEWVAEPEALKPDPKSAYKASVCKIFEMLRRAYATGFTSYFG